MVDRVEVHVWQGDRVDFGFVSSALEAIRNDIEPAVNFSVWGIDKATNYPKFSTSKSKWGVILDEFSNFVETHYMTPPDNEYHMLLLNRAIANGGILGAGQCFGQVGYKEDTWNGSLATVGGVNVAVKFYEDLVTCYGGPGSTMFKNTVIHEACHGFLHPDFNSFPADSCSNDRYVREHSLGTIYGGILTSISPMQTWYSKYACDNNQVVCDNCDNNPYQHVTGITTTLSDCATTELNKYWDNIKNNI